MADMQGQSYQLRVADKLASKPEERLLEVVVGLGGDVVVLEVLLAVEGDGLGLHLTLLHIDLVTGQDNGDVLADTDEVTWKNQRCAFSILVTSRTYGASWERSCR